MGETLTCPPSDGQRADARQDADVASAAGLSTWSNEDSRGVPDDRRSIGTSLALVNPGHILMSPTKSPASVTIIGIVERHDDQLRAREGAGEERLHGSSHRPSCCLSSRLRSERMRAT